MHDPQRRPPGRAAASRAGNRAQAEAVIVKAAHVSHVTQIEPQHNSDVSTREYGGEVDR